jgi:hypothetical protein
MFFITLEGNVHRVGSTYDRGEWVTFYTDDDGRVLRQSSAWPARTAGVAERSADSRECAQRHLQTCLERAALDRSAPSHFAYWDRKDFKRSVCRPNSAFRNTPWWLPRYVDEGPVGNNTTSHQAIRSAHD